MKITPLLVALFIIVPLMQANAAVPEVCLRDYQKIVDEAPYRIFMSKRIYFFRDSRELLLSNLEGKVVDSYKKFRGEEFHSDTSLKSGYLQLTSYKVLTKERPKQLLGFQFIVRSNRKSDAIKFTFNQKGMLLNIYQFEDNRDLWVCEGHGKEEVNYIIKLAKASGEYFDYQETRFKDSIVVKNVNELPVDVRNLAEKLKQKQSELNRNVEKSQLEKAKLADKQYEIIKDGKVIGHVIHINDFGCDNPYWDGSGTYYFIYGPSMKVVYKSSWQG